MKGLKLFKPVDSSTSSQYDLFNPPTRPNSISSVLSASPKNREISIWAFEVVERHINRIIRQSLVIVFIKVIFSVKSVYLTKLNTQSELMKRPY